MVWQRKGGSRKARLLSNEMTLRVGFLEKPVEAGLGCSKTDVRMRKWTLSSGLFLCKPEIQKVARTESGERLASQMRRDVQR
jgi:hypothetical protein